MPTKLPDAVNAGDEIEVQLAPRGAYPQIVDGISKATASWVPENRTKTKSQ